jgi:hypothetical protein
MKRLLLSTLATLISLGSLATVASAAQVSPGNPAADLNGDGEVTLTELKFYNRDQRQA